jgi:hypothetical protein
VTGITPGQAEEFAATIDAGARLPTWDEWHDIAGKDNRGGDYPWKDENAGKRIVNYFLSWEQGGSPFRAHVFKELRAPLSSRSVPFPYALVEVDFAPAAAKRKDEPRQLFHLLGNVAELVLFNGGHAVAGGSFDTPYDDMRFSKQPQLKNVPPQELQTKYNGFRLVIALDRASAEFKAAARSGSKR